MKRGLADTAVRGITGEQPEPQMPRVADWQTKAWEHYEAHWLDGFADFSLLISRQLAEEAMRQGYAEPVGPGENLEVEFDLTGNVYRYRWSPR